MMISASTAGRYIAPSPNRREVVHEDGGIREIIYLQDNKKMAYAPVWDVFLNVKIRTVRVSLLGSDLTQLIQGRPHYNGYLYPAKDASFRFFVTWRFLE